MATAQNLGSTSTRMHAPQSGHTGTEMSQATIESKALLSDKAARFTESVIREMTRQAMHYGAVNLAQGFPDFAAPQVIKDAAAAAISGDINQYAITWGARGLRHAIAQKAKDWHGLQFDPETEITVCCGSTEAMISTLMAITNSGDEIVIFEPFYENYGPDAILCGATPRFVKLHPPGDADGDWTVDEHELRSAFSKRT